MKQDSSYVVRRARARELPLLPELERRAGRRFEQLEDLVGVVDVPHARIGRLRIAHGLCGCDERLMR